MAQAKGIECNKARTRVEQLVCGSAVLGDLDEKLDAAWTAAKEGQAPADINRLINEQKLWLQKVRNACADEACLETAYTARLSDLNPFAGKHLTCDQMRMQADRLFNGLVDLGSGNLSPTEVDYHCMDSLGELPFMKKLLQMAEEIRSDGGPPMCTGSLIHAQWRYYFFGLAQAGLAPRTMKGWSAHKGPADWKTFVAQDATRTTTYFQQWSELSPINQRAFAEFTREFDRAAAQLVRRYANELHMSAEEAQSAAKVALSGVVQRAAGAVSKSDVLDEFALLQQLRSAPLGQAHIVSALPGLSPSQRMWALRLALVYNQPLEVVAALTDAVHPAQLLGIHEEADTGLPDITATPEPLLSLALGSLANLEHLLRRNVPVDAANGFGKTALFYAIGAGNHAAVDLLLRYQADVRHTYKLSKELRPDNAPCVYPNLLHTGRTTLMHAAQNADVPMLKVLLKAGAALQARDELGFNAHDFARMGKKTDNALYLSSLGLEPAQPQQTTSP